MVTHYKEVVDYNEHLPFVTQQALCIYDFRSSTRSTFQLNALLLESLHQQQLSVGRGLSLDKQQLPKHAAEGLFTNKFDLAFLNLACSLLSNPPVVHIASLKQNSVEPTHKHPSNDDEHHHFSLHPTDLHCYEEHDRCCL